MVQQFVWHELGYQPSTEVVLACADAQALFPLNSHVDLSFLSNQRLDLTAAALLVFSVISQSYRLL